MRLSFLDSHLDVSLAPGADITRRALAAVAARPAWTLTGRGDLGPDLLPAPPAVPSAASA
ncbi:MULTISPECIES: hypothetical protein [unclassified Nocardiopsis]|uniref:hypothetical protein n=1 Tax=Nocardiopsis TaxID=2013 RepID=UPI00387B88E9